MLELLVMAAAQVGAPPPVAKPAPPPADLIEFLGEWSDVEANLIDEVVKPPAKPVPDKEKRGAQK
ncbi:MAG: hypothetical protein ABI616_06680 [Pseudomonadota bacterium]